MNYRVLQALLAGRSNRFGPEKVYVLGYKDEGLEIGILRVDETKDRVVITAGEIITLGGEKWRVGFIIPGVAIPEEGVGGQNPHAVVQLEQVD